MRVFAYTWAGGRTDDPNSSSRFFSDILGLRRVYDGKGLVQFELPSGQLFEVFGSESRYYQFHNCPVVGFQVEDLRAAKQEMESKGIHFMTDVLGNDKEAWAYFRGPDGYLYEIWQTQRSLKAPLRST